MTTRKRRGSVFSRSGSWGFSFSYTVNGERQQIKRQGFSTRKEADQELTRALASIDGGRLLGAGRQTVEGFLLSWLESWSGSNRVKPTTIATTTIDIKRYLVPVLGHVLLRSLQPKAIDDCLNHLLNHGRISGDKGNGAGLSPKSVRNIFGTLHRALNDAVRWGLIPHNPADKVTPPRWERPAITTWSPEQVAAFLSHVNANGDPLAAIWRLLLVTGMRRGELLGLRWQDIDLVEGTVTVVQTRVVAGSRVIVSTPKSKAGNRTISIDPGTVTQLAELKNAQEAAAQRFGHWRSDLVVLTQNGHAMQPKDLLLAFQRAARLAGLPKIKLHEGRHTAVTWALQQNTPLHVVSQRVGHAQASTTQNIYAHVLPNADRQAADQIGSALENLLTQEANKALRGSSVVAADPEPGELHGSVQRKSLQIKDQADTENPEGGAPPRIRT